MKNKIISILLICSIVLMNTVSVSFADDVPTADELKNKVEEARDKGNRALIHSACMQDYSTIVNQTEDLRVDIDESNLFPVRNELFGVQYEFSDNYLSCYSNGQLREDLIKTAKESGPISVLRLGGGSVENLNYMNVVGPVEKRKTTELVKVRETNVYGNPGGASAYRMGLPETIKMYYENNPNGKILVCFSLWCTPTEDLINLIHYLIDDKDESQWGALRAEDGIEDPVEIWGFELGNEIDGWSTNRKPDRINNYIHYAEEAITTIRDIIPDAYILACGPTAPWGGYFGVEETSEIYWDTWVKAVMPSLIDGVDAIAYHPYYDGYSVEVCMMFADKMHTMISKMCEEADLRTEDGQIKDIEVVLTEHNRYTPYPVTNCNFQSAVSVAHFYNETMKRKWVSGATLHNLTGYWCAFWVSDNGNILPSATAKMHKMYLENIGDRVVDAKWTRTTGGIEKSGGVPENSADEEYFEHQDFSILATASGKNELVLFMTDIDAYKNFNITFNFKHKYTLVSETIFKAPNSATYPCDEEAYNAITVTTTEKNIPDFKTYTTPTEGIVVLRLRTTDNLPTLDGESNTTDGVESVEAPESEVNHLNDIEGCYTKNEINALYESEIITGDSNGNYNPNDIITRAETAKIVSKIIGDGGYRGNLWLDVDNSDWFMPYANSLYVNGIVTGDYFRGNESLKVIDLMQIAGKVCKLCDSSYKAGCSEYNGENLGEEAVYVLNKGLFSKIFNEKPLSYNDEITRADAATVFYKLSKLN